MINYVFILSLLFLAGSLGLALKPSPIYGGLGLIICGCIGCLMVLGLGGSFLGLIVFLIYLGGMLVVFGYTTAMATEEYPETWGSNWLVFWSLVVGLLVEVVYVGLLNYFSGAGLIDLVELDDWLIYEVDIVGMMLEGGIGVAGLYDWAVWMMVIAGWSLFAGVFIVIEVTRD
uniref:NADH-ubiquinone oxidoreductase chain 6 n=1 Tax=Pseudomys chapmani TaxID=221128 RepID=E3NYS4_9MURI|nr:NADH dehydrogenase subunit 6 [Pseudomys chapmani]ABX75340.1 NADH dehydrogenase subunit 6 [Pseudomys chapmani]